MQYVEISCKTCYQFEIPFIQLMRILLKDDSLMLLEQNLIEENQNLEDSEINIDPRVEFADE